MTTGASIFFTILLLFAVLFMLGYLVNNTIQMNGEMQQARQAAEQCQQVSARLRSDLEAARNENQRLEQENRELKSMAQKQGQELEAAQTGHQQAESEISLLRQKTQDLEKQLAGKQALSEVAVAQAGVWKQQVDQLTQEHNTLEANCYELSQKYDRLTQANEFLHATGLWMEASDNQTLAGLLTGSLVAGSLLLAATGRYVRRPQKNSNHPG